MFNFSVHQFANKPTSNDHPHGGYHGSTIVYNPTKRHTMRRRCDKR
jgi:hypothetical protein